MKRNLIFLAALCTPMLASCAEPEAPIAQQVVEDVLSKKAIAIWADTGSVITNSRNGETLINSAQGAHAPILATSFLAKVGGETYKASISWSGIDNVNWKSYVSDDDHIVVIPSRQSVGGETLNAAFVPTITFEDASVSGSEYKFTCAPYDVDPVDLDLEDFANKFYVTKEVKKNDIIRTRGIITAMSPDLSSVIVQNGNSAVQLYKSSAFSTFYSIGAAISVVGKIKDYNGLEFDPVLDVSPTDASDLTVNNFEANAENIANFKAAWNNGNKSLANVQVKDTLEVDRLSGKSDTLHLKTADDGKISLYTKPGFAGDDGVKAIGAIFNSLQVGDRVTFNGVLTYYSSGDLVEVNIYGAEFVNKAE